MKGVAPLIHEISFGALLADKAFDADWLLQDLDERGANRGYPDQSEPKSAARLRCAPVQVAASHRKLLRKDQGIQGHSHKIRQDR